MSNAELGSRRVSSRAKLSRLEGWFAAAFSSELRPGQILSRRYFGRDIVFFRTESGKPCAVDAHCPHLGAHLGNGGSVEGEHLRCGFHGFCFDTEGRCVATGYGSSPPPAARARTWPVQEKNEVILIHHGCRDEEPDWEIPTLDSRGWSPLRGRRLDLRVHPEDIFENGVDMGHFPFVHGYSSIRADGEIRFEYPRLSARYGMDRQARFGFTVRTLHLEYDIAQYGLGYDVISSHEQSLDLATRHFIMPIPIDDEQCEVRLGVSMLESTDTSRINRVLGAVPRPWANSLVSRLILREFVNDHLQDVKFWTDRGYVENPPLAKGDGPIHRYRNWARQFYSDDAAPVEPRRLKSSAASVLGSS